MSAAGRITPESLLTPAQYQLQRPLQRARALSHRRRRSVGLGPAMWLQFEDEASVRYQIQEVLHAERVTERTAVQRVIRRYAHLLGDARQWRATLFVRLPGGSRQAAGQTSELQPLLGEAALHLYVGCGPRPRIAGRANPDLAAREPGRAAAVHFLCFDMNADARAALRAGEAAVLGCAHPGYAWQRRMPQALLRSLCGEPSAERCDEAG